MDAPSLFITSPNQGPVISSLAKTVSWLSHNACLLCGAAALGLLAPEALSQNFLLSSAARAVPNS